MTPILPAFDPSPGEPPIAEAAPVAPEPPKLTAKVIGFRLWTLEGYRLRSIAVEYRWVIGVNEARCHYLPESPGAFGPSHVAPVHACQCGLYAFHFVPW